MSKVPFSVATKRVLDWCENTMKECPGGTPKSFGDFSAIVGLSAYGNIAASVQMEQLEIGNFSYSDEQKWRVLNWIAQEQGVIVDEAFNERILEPRDVGASMATLWSGVETRRDRLFSASLDIQERLHPLLPKGFAADPHQLEALALFERMNHHMLCADDMGLGKTIVALCAIALAGEAAFPVFVACPASVVYTWAKEAERWLAHFEPTVDVITTKYDSTKLKKSKNPFLIGSYEQLLGYNNQVLHLAPNFVIGDESHYLQRWDSQRTRAFMRLRNKSSYRMLLSGTPMPNGRHRELYAQLKFVEKEAFTHLLRPGQKGDHQAYKWRFCGPTSFNMGRNAKGKPRKITKYDGRSNEVEFGKLLTHHMVRRTKTSVGLKGLKTKTRYGLEVPLKPKQRMALAKIKDAVAERVQTRARELEAKLLEEGVPFHEAENRVKRVLASEVVSQLTELRQALGKMKLAWSVVRLKEHLAAGHRVVVFAYHKDVAYSAKDIYAKAAGGRDNVLVGTGDLVGKKRFELVERAQAGEGKVIVLTRAFREGITLTSFTRGMFAERFWVPGEELQAEDRIYRRGQESDVSWDYLTASGTVDDQMTELITWKEEGQQQAHGAMEERVLTWIMEKGT